MSPAHVNIHSGLDTNDLQFGFIALFINEFPGIPTLICTSAG
jgi:membrane protein YqaA with SNARE-associated domain